VQLGGYETYVATPESPPEGKESRAIVFFYDVFGLGIKNPKVSFRRFVSFFTPNGCSEAG